MCVGQRLRQPGHPGSPRRSRPCTRSPTGGSRRRQSPPRDGQPPTSCPAQWARSRRWCAARAKTCRRRGANNSAAPSRMPDPPAPWAAPVPWLGTAGRRKPLATRLVHSATKSLRYSAKFVGLPVPSHTAIVNTFRLTFCTIPRIGHTPTRELLKSGRPSMLMIRLMALTFVMAPADNILEIALDIPK